jgi:hypothetical protein
VPHKVSVPNPEEWEKERAQAHFNTQKHYHDMFENSYTYLEFAEHINNDMGEDGHLQDMITQTNLESELPPNEKELAIEEDLKIKEQDLKELL